MEIFHQTLKILANGLNVFSILVLLWGSVVCLFRFLKTEFTRLPFTERARSLIVMKNELGVYILLSLEILIAADIVETILDPSWIDLGRLGIIVAIRTVVAYFLNKEIQGESVETREEEGFAPERASSTDQSKSRGSRSRGRRG